MTGILDRFEGGKAVIELADSTHKIVERTLVINAVEGDVLSFDEAKGEWTKDAAKTAERRANLQAKMRNFWK